MADAKPDGRPNGESTLPTASRQRSSAYPRYTLSQAEDFGRAAFQVGPRHCNQERVAQKAGYSPTSGSYKSLRATATYFGIVEVNAKGDLSVTDEWVNVFHSEDEGQLRRARQEAVYRPALYRQLLNEYEGRMIPSAERLARELYINSSKYGILREAADSAVRTFIVSATYAGVIDDRGYVKSLEELEQALSELSPNEFQGQDVPSVFSPPVQSTSQGQLDGQQHVLRQQSPMSSQSNDSTVQTISIPANLDRYEVNLRNGKKAFLFVPPALREKDKDRLKGYIDLIEDEEETTLAPQPNDSGQSNLQMALISRDDDDVPY